MPEADDLDRRIVLATQGGLPLVPRPYDRLAEQLGCSSLEVKERLARMLDSGLVRRIGAVPNHYALGYRFNGMTVWDVDDAKVDELGVAVGQLSFVTHCYRRPRRLPLWPYNLFAMVHSSNREDADAMVSRIAELLGEACRAHEVLFSSRILKKSGLRIAG